MADLTEYRRTYQRARRQDPAIREKTNATNRRCAYNRKLKVRIQTWKEIEKKIRDGMTAEELAKSYIVYKKQGE